MLPIPMLPVFNWGAAGTRRLEGGFPSQSGKLSTTFHDTSKESGREKEKIPLHPL